MLCERLYYNVQRLFAGGCSYRIYVVIIGSMQLCW